MLKKFFNTENSIGYLLLLPSIIIYGIFVFVPLITTIIMSFMKYNLFEAPTFVGLKNFEKLLSNELFWTSTWNTIVYAISSIIFSLILGLLLAVILNSKLKGKKIFRTIFYLPNVISLIAASMAWLYIYDSTNGILNMIMDFLGLSQHNWLMSVEYAMPALIIMNIWRLAGFTMIVYLSGLQTIPHYLYEASRIDGASRIRQFFSITIPMLAPTTFFLVVMTTIFSFQVFDQVYVMTSGGPMNSTTTIVHQIYKNAFEGYKMGYASSMSVVLLIMIIIITLINFKYGNRGGDTEIG